MALRGHQPVFGHRGCRLKCARKLRMPSDIAGGTIAVSRHDFHLLLGTGFLGEDFRRFYRELGDRR